jgi:hypothetical protein
VHLLTFCFVAFFILHIIFIFKIYFYKVGECRHVLNEANEVIYVSEYVVKCLKKKVHPLGEMKAMYKFSEVSMQNEGV